MDRLICQIAKVTLVALAIRAVVLLDRAFARIDAVGAQVGVNLDMPQVTRASEQVGAPAMTPARAREPLILQTVERRFDGFVLPELFRDSIVRFATALVGKRYRVGGTTPQRGFDCSGLVRYVLSGVHITLPRSAYLQARVGAAISQAEVQPGDIVTFGPDSVSHIGIYIGDGKFVHASSVAGRVVISKLDRKPSKSIKPFYGARRLLALYETPFYQSMLQTASR